MTMNLLEKFRTKPRNKPLVASTRKQIPRSTGLFVKLSAWQAEKLHELDHVCWPLFAILLFENFRHRGKTFILPTDKLATLRGVSRRNLRRILHRLEGSGLIVVKRTPPKPPEITVLSDQDEAVYSATHDRVTPSTRPPVAE